MKILTINKIFFLFLIFFLQKNLYANENCDFKSSSYIDELSNPKNIEQIKIVTPNSSKYAQNSFKIITSSKLGNIPKNLKKNIKANLKIIYTFGECNFKASVRQHGDWLDHIVMNKNGEFLRSLDVKIKNGSILNNVRFKLLIPETRNNFNEILGTILLKELGFIAPETFLVHANVNGYKSEMLFQESVNKELLEKNKRREGPILEGDESYLWSYKNYKNFELENISLSKVVNEKWSLKGKNSQKITLHAYQRLQNAYLEYSQNISDNMRLGISPNKDNTRIFNEYYLTLLALNGGHALRPHNSKYYYNIFEDLFEPIYYDGMMELHRNVVVSKKHITQIKNSNSLKVYKPLISNLDDLSGALQKFKNSLLNADNWAEEYFHELIENIKSNERYIEKIYNNSPKKIENEKTKNRYFEEYLKRINKHKVDQTTLVSLMINENNFVGITNKKKNISLTKNDFLKIISRRSIDNKSIVLIQRDQEFSKLKKGIKILKNKELGTLRYSKGISLNIDYENKQIKIFQRNKSDWILFNKAILNGWAIFFKGINQSENEINLKERMNEYGLTGCLNFYDSKFNKTYIRVETSYCEDGLNIVKSKGNLSKITVNNSYSDAVDFDFSDIKIKSLFISKANNDCLDVSGGNYIIQNFSGDLCKDKGISVGEKSKLYIENFKLIKSNIAISSKDSSITKIDNSNIENVEVCYEVKQKKQEFDGAKLFLKNKDLNCNEKILIDQNSELIIL